MGLLTPWVQAIKGILEKWLDLGCAGPVLNWNWTSFSPLPDLYFSDISLQTRNIETEISFMRMFFMILGHNLFIGFLDRDASEILIVISAGNLAFQMIWSCLQSGTRRTARILHHYSSTVC